LANNYPQALTVEVVVGDDLDGQAGGLEGMLYSRSGTA
jgi:hypothetical protein